MKAQLIDRLSRYVKSIHNLIRNLQLHLQLKQWDLLILLQQELEGFGLETNLDDNGYLFATLESNVSFDVPTVGFLAHVDTSPDFNASNVNPQIVEQYDGKTIKLGDTGRVLSQETFPELKTYRSYANDY